MVEGGEEGEVGYVLDASAIGALLERLGERGLRYLEGAVTLDLALYELGNILWKACRLRGAIGEEALEGARGLARVLELVERRRLGGEDMEGVMALALSLGLTFYDASYLYFAKSRGGALVTEDGDLRERTKAAGVRAIGVEEYLTERERDRARKR